MSKWKVGDLVLIRMSAGAVIGILTGTQEMFSARQQVLWLDDWKPTYESTKDLDNYREYFLDYEKTLQ